LSDRRPEPDPILPPRHRGPSRRRDLAPASTIRPLPRPNSHHFHLRHRGVATTS
jgi:hypothetical protein